MIDRSDETDHVLNEGLLWADARLWQSIMQSTTNAIGILDAEGKLIMVNQRACEITGYTQDELIGRMFSMILPEEDLPPVYERVMRTLTDGIPISEFETRLVRKDGLIRIIRFNLEALTIRGSLRVAVGTAEDITERRQYVDALRKSEERFFKAFNGSPDPMIICRLTDGLLLYVNESFIQATGYTSEEVLGHDALELGLFSDPADRSRLVQQLKGRERIYKRETQVCVKGGGQRTAQLSVEIIEADHQRCILVLAADVTEHKRLEEHISEAAEQLDGQVVVLPRKGAQEFGSGRIICKSPKMQEAVALASLAADSRSASVLLLGESGTGKGLVAEEINAASPRAGGPFVVVNCGALSPTLIEAELFGYEKGAFTGATGRKKGVFEQAHNGTLLLDEIGELPLNLQVKILRVVEKRMVRRLGGDSETQIDVRIIAATNRELDEDVRRGIFREDLFYRLNVIRIVIPPLRERVEDILPLSAHFVARFVREAGKHIRGLTREAEAVLRSYSWPGNVRELSNVIESAVVIEQERDITSRSLKLIGALRKRGASAGTNKPPFSDSPITIPLPTGARFDEFATWAKRELAQVALAQTNGNKKRAAALLGLSRFQFNRRLKSLGLEGQVRK